MALFRKRKIRQATAKFMETIHQEAMKAGICILGECSLEHNVMFASQEPPSIIAFSFDYNRLVFQTTIEYSGYSDNWMTRSFIGNGFSHIFDSSFLGKNTSEVAQTLSSFAHYCAYGKFEYSSVFSLVLRNASGIHPIGVGVRDQSGTYYLYENELKTINVPQGLLVYPHEYEECYTSGNQYISFSEYQKKCKPVRVGNNYSLALKILLTVREEYKRNEWLMD